MRIRYNNPNKIRIVPWRLLDWMLPGPFVFQGDMAMTLNDLSSEQQEFVHLALSGKNVLCDACIGSGKTSTINVLCDAYPPERRNRNFLFQYHGKLFALSAIPDSLFVQQQACKSMIVLNQDIAILDFVFGIKFE